MTVIEADTQWRGELAPDRNYGMLIDGEFVGGEGGGTFQCEYPFDGKKWGSVPLATANDVDRAVQAAHRAFQTWSRTRPLERATLLRRLADLILEDVDALCKLQVHENGKLLSEMKSFAAGMAATAEYMAGLAESTSGHTSPSNLPGCTSYSVREPIGVVAAITPWNTPLGLLAWKLFPALAAGNTVVAKPSEVTPLSTLRLGELCVKAGFPAGVVNIVTGYGDVGAALVAHPLVDKIAFTGGTTTGQKIAATAALRGARVSLELGGKSPNIIFADADLDAAIQGIIDGIFGATGQSCIAGSRILVQEGVGDEFFDKLKARVEALTIGDPLNPDTQIAPLASRAQLERVLHYIEVGKEDGARLLTGGTRPEDPALADGFFVRPTLFTDVENEFRIAQEEVFGPIGVIIRFKDEEDALRIANASDFGLAAAVWTENVRRAHRMVPQLRAGTVWVNAYRVADYTRPFGGYKQSGIGREIGVEALHDYTEVKSVYIMH